MQHIAAMCCAVHALKSTYTKLSSDLSSHHCARLQVAAAVAQAAFKEGVSGLAAAPGDWLEYVEQRMWSPTERTTRVAGMPVQAGNSRLGRPPVHPPAPHEHA